MESRFQNLIRTYHELNSESIDILLQEPSPLQFMKHVTKNRPFIVRAGCSNWPAVSKWNEAYLTQRMGNRCVRIAVTPNGNADAPTANAHGPRVYAEPYESEMCFSLFLSTLGSDEARAESHPVHYSQAQNDNLRREYSALIDDVEPSIEWADNALGGENALDAVNLWIGTERSVTALHRDNYENVYCQILGQKHFVLLPPIAVSGVNEQWLSRWVYDQNMDLHPIVNAEKIPVAIWDPDQAGKNATASSPLCKPMRVTLEPGDMMYLPSCWYHKVSQSPSEEGISCSVNYWYDQNYDGTIPAALDFIRSVAWDETARHETARTS